MLIPPAHVAAPLLAGGVTLSVPIPLAIALFVVGLLGYALINAIEIAVIASNRLRVRAAAEEGHRAALALERLRATQERYFAVVVVVQNVCVFLASTAGAIVSISSRMASLSRSR